MKVLFFGRLAEAIAPELEVEVSPGRSIAQLRQDLSTRYPHAATVLASQRSRACVGDALVGDEHVVRADDTIEFLPPVSGG